MKIDQLHNEFKVFNISIRNKKKFLLNFFNYLIKHHYKNSILYKKILDVISPNIKKYDSLEDMPFLPVKLFKEHELISIKKKEIFKTIFSSGTSGSDLSKIFLDKYTSLNQIKALNQIVGSFIGNKKLPMLIIDSENTLKNRNSFNARGAGILGFSLFSSKNYYALNKDLSLNIDAVNSFFDFVIGQPFIIYGFTSIVWETFVNNSVELMNFDFTKGIIIHGGGWKKLINKNIQNNDFKIFFKKNFLIKQIYNYYGMVEQTGSIFFECECGNFVTSKYSEIIIRDKEFNVCPNNIRGIVQLFSVLPSSYPGHILLTEDEGMILDNHICSSNRLGTHFKIFGRLKNAEIKGCSDAH